MKKLALMTGVILSCFLLYLFLVHPTQLSLLDVDGYAVSNNQIAENLLGEVKEQYHSIPLVSFEAMDLVYQEEMVTYIDQKAKKVVNPMYPFYRKDGSAIVNMSTKSKLIDDQFDVYDTYLNVTLANGILYNQYDKERADEHTYYFLQLQNQLFVNSYPLFITRMQEQIIIPANSIVAFKDNQIRYYTLDGDHFYYASVDGMDYDSQVQIDQTTSSYYELLLALGLKKESSTEPSPKPDEPVKPPTSSYVEPTVTCDSFEENIYYVSSRLTIHDPSSVITSLISFEVKKGTTTFLRKSYARSGQFELGVLEPDTTYTIIGSYEYLDASGNPVKKTFLEEKVKTKKADTIAPATLSFDTGEIYYDRIELKDFKITDGLTKDLIKGAKRLVLNIDDQSFSVTSQALAELLAGNAIVYQSPSLLDSNQTYSFSFHLYDAFSNEIALEHASGTARTSLAPPKVTVKVQEADVTSVTLKVELKNKDQVALDHYRYLVYDKENTIIADGNLVSSTISLNSLESNEVFTIAIYADFDLEDGKGIQKDVLLNTTRFTSMPITTLGIFRVASTYQNLTSDSVTLTYRIEDQLTDVRLRNLLSEFTVLLKQGEEVIQTTTLSEAEVTELKNGSSLRIPYQHLTSMTNYQLVMKAKIKQGRQVHEIEVVIRDDTFQTLKRTPEVFLSKKFVTESMLDFDIEIQDLDGAILSDRALLELRDAQGKLVSIDSIALNQEPKRMTYSYLTKEEVYTLKVIAESYNVGYDNATFETNYLLYEEQNKTVPGILGSLQLNSLLKKIEGKNLYQQTDPSKWTAVMEGVPNRKQFDEKEGTITFYTSNNEQLYSYFLPEYKNQQVTISFYAKSQSPSPSPVFLSKDISLRKDYQLKNLSTEYQKYTYTTTLLNRGVLGFYLTMDPDQQNGTELVIKDLQIEVGSKATPYEAYRESEDYQATFQVKLEDTREELPLPEYYIGVYQKETLIERSRYEMETEPVDATVLKTIPPNREYEIRLQVLIKGRYYDLDRLSFLSDREIRMIQTKEDLMNLTPTGNYLVAQDLDLRSKSGYVSLPFSGTMDFQGHHIQLSFKDSNNHIFRTVTSSGIIRNVVLDYELNNETPINTNFYGLVFNQQGLLENIVINIYQSNQQLNTFVSLLCYNNMGTIRNFVVNAYEPLYVSDRGSYLVSINDGTIKNGYVQGAPLEALENVYADGRSKQVGLISGYSGNNGSIQNVFVLNGVNAAYPTTKPEEEVGNIVGYCNQCQFDHVYSVGDGNNRNLAGDPSYGKKGNVRANDLFFAGRSIYQSTDTQKISTTALHDPIFQNKVLNSEQQFQVDVLVEAGYYPQLILPDFMPKQEYIPLEPVEDLDLVDVNYTELVRSDGGSAIVKLHVHNPASEKITSIEIKDLTTKILSQVDQDGTSEILLEVMARGTYTSFYQLRAITSVGVYGIAYTHTYEENERMIAVDLFREIHSIDDFKKINNLPKENYRLMEDLDFKNATSFQINQPILGIIDGNGHTLKNITITSGDGLFTRLNGTIKNLTIENYQKTSRTSHSAVVVEMSAGAKLDQVHLKNYKGKSLYMVGGLVSYARNSTIRNCSVTDFQGSNEENASDFAIGAIVAYFNGGTLENSYAQGINISVQNASSTTGIGGLVGNVYHSEVSNAYAEGKIVSDAIQTGGLFGLSDTSTLKNLYSNVSIVSSLDYVGGIVGSSNKDVTKTLVLGSIYNSAKNSVIQNTRRTIGNQVASFSNYVWDQQQLNGLLSTSTSGETLLSTEQLKNPYTYETLMKLGPMFSYEQVTNGILPKLYATDQKTLLPNQRDQSLQEEPFRITSIDYVKRVTDATILLTFENPNEVAIDHLEFDYLKVTSVTKQVTNEGITTMELIVEPTYALDSYCLKQIVYQGTNGLVATSKQYKIDLQFYKSIEKVEDWKAISTTIPENYRLVADLDFENTVNLPLGVVINRLEGVDGQKTIRNITIQTNQANVSLIQKLNSSIQNISFENIRIESTSTAGMYINLIQTNYAVASDLMFQNITLLAPNMNRVAIIGFNRSEGIRNIQIDGLEVSGNKEVAGFIANTWYNFIDQVDAKNLNITGVSYVGGLIGMHEWTNLTAKKIINLHVSNSTIRGESYVGGLIGQGGASSATITDSTIEGSEKVGGMFGQSNSYHNYDLIADHITVKGSKKAIGGLAGNEIKAFYNCFVLNSEIIGTLPTTESVGGLGGTQGNTYKIYGCGVVNSTIHNEGINTGGILGTQTGIINASYVHQTTVQGRKNTGGISGKMLFGTLDYVTSNATVISTEENAGGVIGYMENLHSTPYVNVIRLQFIIVANTNVIANRYAGGIIGYADQPMVPKYAQIMVVVANLYTKEQHASASSLIGNRVSDFETLSSFLLYDKNEINGIKEIETDQIPKEYYISSEQLRQVDTYKALGFTSINLDFTSVTQGYFPKTVYEKKIVAHQLDLVLPNDGMFRRASLMAVRKLIDPVHELPTLDGYASGIHQLNLEFSNIDDQSSFTYTINGVTSDPIVIKQRTYTFSYDFKTDFVVTVFDGINQKVWSFRARDLANPASVTDQGYYYLYSGILYSNHDVPSGSYVHLYQDQALRDDGKVYSFVNQALTELPTHGLTLLEQPQPLFEFSYQEKQIQTYYRYSLIQSNGEETLTNAQLVVKNGILDVIHPSVPSKRDQLIIDHYGGNHYQAVLGVDGVFYQLKRSFQLPKEFEHDSIQFMTNNLATSESLVLMVYENGSIYGFDYRTGKEVLKRTVKEDTDIVSYFIDHLKKKNYTMDLHAYPKYEASKTLEEKINQVNKQQQEAENAETGLEIPYEKLNALSVYNPVTKKFDLYHEEDLLKKDVLDVSSLEDQIYREPDLVTYYFASSPIKQIQNHLDQLFFFFLFAFFFLIAIFAGAYNMRKMKERE